LQVLSDWKMCSQTASLFSNLPLFKNNILFCEPFSCRRGYSISFVGPFVVQIKNKMCTVDYLQASPSESVALKGNCLYVPPSADFNCISHVSIYNTLFQFLWSTTVQPRFYMDTVIIFPSGFYFRNWTILRKMNTFTWLLLTMRLPVLYVIPVHYNTYIMDPVIRDSSSFFCRSWIWKLIRQ